MCCWWAEGWQCKPRTSAEHNHSCLQPAYMSNYIRILIGAINSEFIYGHCGLFLFLLVHFIYQNKKHASPVHTMVSLVLSFSGLSWLEVWPSGPPSDTLKQFTAVLCWPSSYNAVNANLRTAISPWTPRPLSHTPFTFTFSIFHFNCRVDSSLSACQWPTGLWRLHCYALGNTEMRKWLQHCGLATKLVGKKG